MNAWLLLLTTVVPFRLLTAVGSGGLIRQRLFAGLRGLASSLFLTGGLGLRILGGRGWRKSRPQQHLRLQLIDGPTMAAHA